jgi:acyl dehydratase
MTRHVMAVSIEVIGKSYPATTYAVGREKIHEYALAVGETNPLHLDVEAARAAGYDDVVAPPMFSVVYAMPAVAGALFDPEVGIDFARLVHSGQDFSWGPLVIAGDEITTTVTVSDVSERRGNGFYVFGSVSSNQRGDTVCTGRWSNIVRAA